MKKHADLNRALISSLYLRAKKIALSLLSQNKSENKWSFIIKYLFINIFIKKIVAFWIILCFIRV